VTSLAVTGSGTITSATIALHFTHTWRVLANASISVAGKAAAGTWQLNVVDHAGQDVGTTDSRSLTLNGPP